MGRREEEKLNQSFYTTQVGVDFLRLGLASRVHPDILPYTPAHTSSDTSSVKALEQLYHTRPVVATTCLGMHHPIFVRRSFDYCIIDEASQITLPVSLGPLRHTRVFVLVGDHYQLPPLVQSEQARCGPPDSLAYLCSLFYSHSYSSSATRLHPMPATSVLCSLCPDSVSGREGLMLVCSGD